MATATTSGRTIFESEHDDYRESFRRFLEAEVKPHYDDWNAAGIIPREMFAKAAEHGFLAMEVPEEYGGQGVDDWRFNVVLMEEAATSGVGDAWAGPLLHTDVCLPYFMASCTEEQKARWLPGMASGELIAAVAMTEPGTGSDLAAIATSAKRDGDTYILNGAKTFITNGINADLVIVAARTSDDPHGGLSLFIVERGFDGFERGKQIEKLGQHASDTAELFFNDCVVPAENLLGEENQGFYAILANFASERLFLAGQCVTIAQLAYQESVRYARDRAVFGKSLMAHQVTRHKLADMASRIAAARAITAEAVIRTMRDEQVPGLCAMAKNTATDMVAHVCDQAVQLHGGNGYMREYLVERLYRDARLYAIGGGTREIMNEIISKTEGY